VAKRLLAANVVMMIHSVIGGPWMPDDVVMGMSLSVTIGCSVQWSTPAENK
jgi:hypothetical protein